jgi:hypothetical protein
MIKMLKLLILKIIKVNNFGLNLILILVLRKEINLIKVQLIHNL